MHAAMKRYTPVCMPQAVAESSVPHVHASIRVFRVKGLEGDVVSCVVLWKINEFVFCARSNAVGIVIEGGAHQPPLSQQNVLEGAVVEVQHAPERHIKHLSAQIQVFERTLPEGYERFEGDEEGRLGTAKPYEAAACTTKWQLSVLLLMYTHLVILFSGMSI